MIIAFDIGKTIENDPSNFANMMRRLRHDGHVVYILTALRTHPSLAVDPIERHGFACGRLFQLGLRRGIHYDKCFIVDDPDMSGPRTGKLKNEVVLANNIDMHVDDNEHVLGQMDCKRIHYTNEPIHQVYASIVGLSNDK